MGRMSERKAEIEAIRMEKLHAEQTKLRRRLKRELRVKKAGHFPGLEVHKKHLAVLIKIGTPNISNREIAERIGETRATVKEWFRTDPEVKEFYQFVIEHFKQGALELMQTYSLEAVEVLVVLMRFGSEKYMFESAREILDRVGLPKVERHEVEREDIKSHKWADRDQLVSEIRELAPEQQEEAVEALEKFEELLAHHAKTNGDGLTQERSDLDTISKLEDDELDDEEEDE